MTKLRIQSEKILFNPQTLQQELPLSIQAKNMIQHARQTATNILQGKENRLLVVVGPCSIHDSNAALEYAALLREAANRYADDLFIIMRVYFEKPRTTVGWKGLISDPFLNGTFDIHHGLRIARQLLLDLNNQGMPAGTEFLDTIIPQYISDLVTWCAIGARTSASQIHREIASGLSMPVGFKNNIDGNINVAIDAVKVASYEHHFLSINQEGNPVIVTTTGNDTCHIILRGSHHAPNYDEHIVLAASKALKEAQLIPKLVIDCSHGNSKKNYELQRQAAFSIAEQIKQGSDIICGVMLESNLLAGKQTLIPGQALVYGQSITDGCLGWAETSKLLDMLACAVKKKT